MSWIYHDSAIEGVVYTFQELRTAADLIRLRKSSPTRACNPPAKRDSPPPREALHFIRDYAPKKRQPITVDLVRKIYLILHPEEGDLKTVKYRKKTFRSTVSTSTSTPPPTRSPTRCEPSSSG